MESGFFGWRTKDYGEGDKPLAERLTVAVAMLGLSKKISIEEKGERIIIKPDDKERQLSPVFTSALIDLAKAVPPNYDANRPPGCLGLLKLPNLFENSKKILTITNSSPKKRK